MSNPLKAIRAFCEVVVDTLEMHAVELRHGISLTEAVAADEFETQLRALTYDAEHRADIRRAALLIGQMGWTSEELAAGFRRLMADTTPKGEGQ